MQRKGNQKTFITIGIHLIVWIMLLIIPAYLINVESKKDMMFLKEVWLQIFFYALIFYVTYFWLVPHFFFSGRRLQFFLLIFILIVGITSLSWMVVQKSRGEMERTMHRKEIPDMAAPDRNPALKPPEFRERRPPSMKNWPLFNFALTSLLVSGLGLGLRFSEKLSQNEKLRKEAEKERADQELNLLKNQINPHFLFNTLNTIYSLALVNSEYTAEAVMKLSDMMRYVLQDVNREKVPVALELDYIRHYVGLQQLRLNQNITVVLEVVDDDAGQQIAPILLIPFVENVFKHGTSAHERAEILIRIKCSGNTLELLTINRIFPERYLEEGSGIGLTNTKKRLELIYPGKHQLDLKDEGDRFIVNLAIELS